MTAASVTGTWHSPQVQPRFGLPSLLLALVLLAAPMLRLALRRREGFAPARQRRPHPATARTEHLPKRRPEIDSEPVAPRPAAPAGPTREEN
ncbi:MAG: hypothetical protein JNL85_05715 [Rubrivivax sp.]|nr:hypothetical protein [Rubrivivax sp.]